MAESGLSNCNMGTSPGQERSVSVAQAVEVECRKVGAVPYLAPVDVEE